MRQFITNDLYKASRILKKLELKKDDFVIDKNAEDFDEQFGFNLLLKIMENAYLAQNEVNDFMGSLCGMTGEEFGNLPLSESMAYMKEFKKLDGISDFFTQVGDLMK